MIIKEIDRLVQEDKLKIENITDFDNLLTIIFNKYNIIYTYIGVTYVEDVSCMTYSFRLGDTTDNMDTYLLVYNLWKNDEMQKFGEPYIVVGFSLNCMKVSNYGAMESTSWNIGLKDEVEESAKEKKERKLKEAFEYNNTKEFKPIKVIDAFFNVYFPKYIENCIDIYKKSRL